MRFSALIAFVAICLGLAAQAPEHYAQRIGDFHELTVANSINVVYRSHPDSAGYVVYDCLPSIADVIVLQNSKGKLKVQLISDNPIETPLPTVTVYSMQLIKCANWGDSTLVVQSNAPGPEFKANVIGNGNIVATGVWATDVSASVKAGLGHVYLAGKCQVANFTLWSSGAIEAGELASQIVKCTVVGTGSIDCTPSEYLSVKGMGSGTIYYRGDVKVKNHSVGVHTVQVP